MLSGRSAGGLVSPSSFVSRREHGLHIQFFENHKILAGFFCDQAGALQLKIRALYFTLVHSEFLCERGRRRQGLARCYIKTGDIARAEQTIGLVPPDKRKAAPVVAVLAALDLCLMIRRVVLVLRFKLADVTSPFGFQCQFEGR